MTGYIKYQLKICNKKLIDDYYRNRLNGIQVNRCLSTLKNQLCHCLTIWSIVEVLWVCGSAPVLKISSLLLLIVNYSKNQLDYFIESCLSFYSCNYQCSLSSIISNRIKFFIKKVILGIQIRKQYTFIYLSISNTLHLSPLVLESHTMGLQLIKH